MFKEGLSETLVYYLQFSAIFLYSSPILAKMVVTRASKLVPICGHVPIEPHPSYAIISSPLSVVGDAATVENVEKSLQNPMFVEEVFTVNVARFAPILVYLLVFVVLVSLNQQWVQRLLMDCLIEHMQLKVRRTTNPDEASNSPRMTCQKKKKKNKKTTKKGLLPRRWLNKTLELFKFFL